MAHLKTIVRSYIRHIRPLAETELAWFQDQPDIRTAIERAALAVNSRGKRYAHQRRLKRKTLEQAREILLRCEYRIRKAKDFDTLFDLIETLLEPVSGIGELYLYDTALRLGATLNLHPSKVYLHAGTRTGAHALGLDAKARALEIAALPEPLRMLRPHEIEDVLCIFKNDFDKPGADAPDRLAKSWCR
jgi:hypothetical protein